MPRQDDIEKTEKEKVLIVPIEEESVETLKISVELDKWTPKTALGKKVKSRDMADIAAVIDSGMPILEPEIIEMLLPGMESDLLMIGQSKGKFGGGSRRVFRQTQKKTKEGNKPKFSTFAVVGNKDGYLGLGFGKAKETVPAREKALRKAKLNLFKLSRGCGSWQCNCKTPHSIPFAVSGKCSSVTVELMPAPKGTGLKAEKELVKILKLAGIQDVWCKARGQTRNKLNVIEALRKALLMLTSTKVQEKYRESLAITQGSLRQKHA
jgi:small subunit ribosomal protein S5